MSNHPIVHIEIPLQDQQSGSQFYADLFGWKVQQMPEMNYALFEAAGGPGGGFPQADGEYSQVGQINIFVDTDDIDATLAKAESLGGKTVLPKTEIPNMGWFAFFTDPDGNRIGIYTGAS